MARPKAGARKLVPVTTYVRPERYDELDRAAKARDIPLSTFLRMKLDPDARIATAETQAPSSRPH